MRCTVDIAFRNDRRIGGTVAVEGWPGDRPFSGWLELIGILDEVPVEPGRVGVNPIDRRDSAGTRPGSGPA